MPWRTSQESGQSQIRQIQHAGNENTMWETYLRKVRERWQTYSLFLACRYGSRQHGPWISQLAHQALDRRIDRLHEHLRETGRASIHSRSDREFECPSQDAIQLGEVATLPQLRQAFQPHKTRGIREPQPQYRCCMRTALKRNWITKFEKTYSFTLCTVSPGGT